jgi:hypothetical protein
MMIPGSLLFNNVFVHNQQPVSIFHGNTYIHSRKEFMTMPIGETAVPDTF